MELFHEYKNRYFNLVFKLLNLSKDGLSREEILKIIDNEAYEEKLVGKDFITFEGLVLNDHKEGSLNLLKEIDGKYYPVLKGNNDIPLEVRFSDLEKEWLKNMLNDEVARDLLGKDLVLKLENKLGQGTTNYNSIIEKTNTFKKYEEENFEKIKESLFIVVNAILGNCAVRYTNIDRLGNEYKDKLAIPIRIEYSLRDDKFRVSIYSLEENRNIMVLLKSLTSLKLEPNIKIEKNRDEIIKELKEKKYCSEPIVLELEDKRGAMERCFMSLSSYERSTRSLGNNRYEIKVNYYSFDEDEVIRKILFLGPYAVVKSPENVRNKIIDILKGVLSNEVS